MSLYVLYEVSIIFFVKLPLEPALGDFYRYAETLLRQKSTVAEVAINEQVLKNMKSAI